MSNRVPQSGPRIVTLDPCSAPTPPAWALAMAPIPEAPRRLDGMTVACSAGPAARLVTVTIHRIRAAPADTLEAMACAAYERIGAELAGVTPVRFWNHIPGIGEDMGAGLDRYRVFNLGRKAALADWFGEGEFEQRLPAATGVGRVGDDLVIHCLASDEPGQPLENPRQRPAYRYSARYGPASPSFARATRTGGGALLVGGTASVRGEQTVHPGDLDGQMAETIENLEALLRAAGAAPELDRFTSVRIYHRRAGDRGTLEGRAMELFGAAEVIEFMRADICRPDLLVEIEGRAELASRPCAQPVGVEAL